MTMDRTARVDRVLPELFTELADARTPAYLEAAIERASSRPQRPAWTFPGRWLPMEISTRVMPAPPMPWRAIGLLTVIGLLLVATLAIYVGRQTDVRPAPPFGPAATGLMAFAQDGDIVAFDSETDELVTVVGGAEIDSAPAYSLDGLQLTFLRAAGADHDVMVASADGTGVRAVTPEPLAVVTDVAFSPDGSTLLIAAARDGKGALAVAATDGTSFDWLPIEGDVDRPSFAPPDGRTIMFVLSTVAATGQSIQTYDLDTRMVSTLVPGSPPNGEIVGAPVYSPDGSRIAYSLWAAHQGLNARVHILDLGGSAGPVQIGTPEDICCEGHPTWSHDGTKLAVFRYYEESHVVAVVPVAGGLGTEYQVGAYELGSMAWSPDDRFVAVVPFQEESGVARNEQVLLDVASDQVVNPAWSTTSDPAWQRVAPSD